MSRGKSVTYVLGALGAITHNVPHVCDVAPSPTRARGHVAERRAAAPRSPSRPAGAPMYIRAVMRSCAFQNDNDWLNRSCRFLIVFLPFVEEV